MGLRLIEFNVDRYLLLISSDRVGSKILMSKVLNLIEFFKI